MRVIEFLYSLKSIHAAHFLGKLNERTFEIK